MSALEPPRVVCLPSGRVVRPRDGETLLDAVRRHGLPLASSCSGRAVCGDCVVRVVEGELTAPTPDEDAWRARRAYSGPLRLACCARAVGDCAISTTYW